MSAWGDLVTACLLGTERRVPEGLDAEIAAVVGKPVAADSPEEGLLVAAGVLGSWRRAGWVPPRSEEPPPAQAPADPRPEAPAGATQLLELLLDKQVPVTAGPEELVGVWLVRCAATGRRLPPRLLPRVLEAATTKQGLRRPAMAAGGARLRWLAARNPAWAWAAPAPAAAGAPADVDEVWATGRRDARLELFTTLRRSDPARARALLEGTWKEEPAADRTRFVEALAMGLGDGDEPFLEAALDDRAKGVRAAAAALLARLPSSRLAARMADRLGPLVTPAGRLRKTVTVALPDDLDAAAVRDGLTEKGAPPKTGPRAWLLIQMIAATPLAFWEERAGAPPERIARQHGGQTELLDGWVRAAAGQRNAAWARALLDQRPDPALLAALPAADAHAALPAVIGRVGDTTLADVVAAAPGPWPLPTSRAVVARLRKAKLRAAVVHTLPVVAAHVDPRATADLDAWARALPEDDATRRHLATLQRTISIRQAIDEELS